MATPLKRFIESRYGGRGLPVSLVLPDGGRIALSPAPEIDVVARSWRGVKALAAPAMGTLARAYVHQDIDFTGSAGRPCARRNDGRHDRRERPLTARQTARAVASPPRQPDQRPASL